MQVIGLIVKLIVEITFISDIFHIITQTKDILSTINDEQPNSRY